MAKVQPISKLIYNSEQKISYINYEKSNEKTLYSIFRNISSKEKEFSKDIVDMNKKEVISTIKTLELLTDSYIRQTLNLLINYAKWAILSGKTTNTNHLEQITVDDIISFDVVRLKMISDPNHLGEILESNLDYCDYPNKSRRDSLIVWLLYSGIEIKDIRQLKIDSINYDDRIVSFDDKRFEIEFNEVLDLWKYVSEMEYIEKKNGRLEDGSNCKITYSECNLSKGDLLFRNTVTRGLAISPNVFPRYVTNATNGIKPMNVMNSGIFYKIKQLEDRGEKITLDHMAFYFGIVKKSDVDCNYANITKNKFTNYKDWKLAFDYV